MNFYFFRNRYFFSTAILFFSQITYSGPIHESVRAGDLDKLQELILASSNPLRAVNELDATTGEIPLHIAALKGDPKIVTALLSAGANREPTVPALVPVTYADLESSEVERLLQCYEKQMGSVDGSAKFKTAFQNFPIDDLYKLFIDKRRRENPEPKEVGVAPHLIFDVKEPGYYGGMTSAFELMIHNIGNPVTIEMLRELHDLAVGQIKTMQKGTSGGWLYPIIDPMDSNALKELVASGIVFSIPRNPRRLFTRLLDPVGTGYFAWMVPQGEELIVSSNFPSDELSITKKISPVLEHYYQQISRITTFKGKLEAIAELLRALEVAHFFPDGNQRVYAFLLMNKLLIENNILPAILENPEIFDGFCTVSTMADNIKKGIKNFLNENPDQQRKFLYRECADTKEESPTSSYLALPSDYFPFYRMGRGTSIENAFRDMLKKEIEVAITKTRVDEKVNIDEMDRAGATALLKAVVIGDEELVLQLLKLGANPLRDWGVLFDEVVASNNFSMAKKLVSNLNFGMFSYDRYDRYDVSALILRLVRSPDLADMGDELMDDLLKRVSNDYDIQSILTETKEVFYALEGWAEKREFRRDILKKYSELLKTMNAQSFPVVLDPARLAQLNRALLAAVRDGNDARVGELLEQGAQVNHAHAIGWTALIMAVINGHLAMFERLLAANADVNHADNLGRTALMMAARLGRAAVVERLLDAPGIDVNHADNDGHNALWHAQQRRNNQAVIALLEEAIARAPQRGAVLSQILLF